MRTYVRYEKCVFENAVLLLMLVEYKLAKIGIASEKYDWRVRDVDGGFKDKFFCQQQPWSVYTSTTFQ